MAITRLDVVDEARRWVRTPYLHQAALFGVGADCVGLIRGVCIRLGSLDEGFVNLPAVEQFKGYAPTPSADGALRRACEMFMTPIDRASAQAGDAVLIQFSGMPHHLGILSTYKFGGLAIIHAMTTPGYVAEHRLSRDWADRIVAAYQLPGVDA